MRLFLLYFDKRFDSLTAANMAEFNDIEYEGIGGDRNIVVEGDRCFQDYSPSDTILDLSDGGEALYARSVPSFPYASQSHEPVPRPQTNDEAVTEAGTPRTPSMLSHRALVAMQKSTPRDPTAEQPPLERYRRDIQVYERLSLGIEPSDFGLLPEAIDTSPHPKIGNGKARQSQSSMISSLHLSLSPSPVPSTGPETSSAAEQLRELLGVIGSPGWEDDTPPEEQAEHLRKATRLKRRVGSETNPREVRLPKVRKRDHQDQNASKGKHSSSS
ncbi:uncharacterized protein F4822DRAFT_63097 [Hypoxylon trugodes]|uniref:uncharacterized protein n=1 Tax=Hypoxylon trugodes TaxID=326681 RepID=UPI0021931F98|nr:uncharacterized protein F4822DRAFT_63097 [Hypoxylon trugodes]KAI1384190.1 hypothetical protein F4822DRAFT_63097 [Hypoxylon trugodes]